MRNAARYLDGKAIRKGLKAPNNAEIIKIMDMVAARKHPAQKNVHIKKETHSFIHMTATPRPVTAVPEKPCFPPQKETILINQAVEDG